MIKYVVPEMLSHLKTFHFSFVKETPESQMSVYQTMSLSTIKPINNKA